MRYSERGAGRVGETRYNQRNDIVGAEHWEGLERRIVRLNREGFPGCSDCDHFRGEVICDAEALFT
jgi:hypothetical protein